MIRPRSLQDAVVVITGASSGVGRATALSFAEHGARLVLAARGQAALDEVVDACADRGAMAIAVPTDVADADAVTSLADQARERFGRLDVWVEAASVLIAGDIQQHRPDEVQRLVDTNVTGAVFGGIAALTAFREQGSGVLIIVSSMLGLVPTPMAPVYSMSKFAARGLALNLRQSVAGERGIDVCAVLPGPVDTPMFQRAANHTGHGLRSIPPAIAPERVAAAIVSCARRPRRQTTAGLSARVQVVAHRITPRLTEFLSARWSAAMVTGPDPAPPTTGALFSPVPDGEIQGGWRRGPVRPRLGSAIGRALARRGSRRGVGSVRRDPSGWPV